ncbi:MAG TPA: hypothetical protein VFI34_03610 [Candidatus Limnocylindrales bacterium]|nr:hypothetical protein [Candidatus Limnocylindrales bacterium]
MRLRRGLVFWGLFLIPLGGIPLLARAGFLPTDVIADAWRLWPLLLIGFGLMLLVGRTRASIAATAVVAIVIGSVAGAAFAAGPPWIGTMADCGFQPGNATERLDRSGTWEDAASVQLDLRCGTLDLHPGAGPGWRFASTHRGSEPTVTASDRSLAVAAPSGTHRQDWILELPAGPVDRMDLTANAASSKVRLDTIQLGALNATVNAGDLGVAVGTGRLDQLDVTVNAGQLRITGGSSDLRGSIAINAGGVDLCVPADANLRLTVTDQLTFSHNLSSRGLSRIGDGTWVRPGSGAAVTLRISGNAATLTLDPEGGCR